MPLDIINTLFLKIRMKKNDFSRFTAAKIRDKLIFS